MVDEGEHCFGLDTPIAYTPLWQVVQAVDGVPAEISFRRNNDEGVRRSSRSAGTAERLRVKPTDYPLAAGQSNQTQAPLDADPDHPSW